MNIKKSLVIVFYFLSSLVSAGTIDPSTSDTKYLEYGKKFDCVVKICGKDDEKKLFEASAVVIDDHHILTAAHVVKDCSECYILMNEQKYNLSEVTIHKDFDTKFGIADLAIGYSKDSFNLDFYPKLYEEFTEVDKVCSISGYGLTGTFNTGAIKSDGKKRAGSNIIDRIYEDMLICNASRRSSGKFTELEFFIASGDSGGGLFIDGKLAGINSCVMASSRSPSSKYDEESGHTRISKFVEWIQKNKSKD